MKRKKPRREDLRPRYWDAAKATSFMAASIIAGRDVDQVILTLLGLMRFKRPFLIKERLKLTPVIRDPADDHSVLVIQEVGERGHLDLHGGFGVTRLVDQQAWRQLVHPSERETRLSISTAHDYKIKLRVACALHLVQVWDEVGTCRTCRGHEHEQPSTLIKIRQADNSSILIRDFEVRSKGTAI